MANFFRGVVTGGLGRIVDDRQSERDAKEKERQIMMAGFVNNILPEWQKQYMRQEETATKVIAVRDNLINAGAHPAAANYMANQFKITGDAMWADPKTLDNITVADIRNPDQKGTPIAIPRINGTATRSTVGQDPSFAALEAQAKASGVSPEYLQGIKGMPKTNVMDITDRNSYNISYIDRKTLAEIQQKAMVAMQGFLDKATNPNQLRDIYQAHIPEHLRGKIPEPNYKGLLMQPLEIRTMAARSAMEASAVMAAIKAKNEGNEAAYLAHMARAGVKPPEAVKLTGTGTGLAIDEGPQIRQEQRKEQAQIAQEERQQINQRGMVDYQEGYRVAGERRAEAAKIAEEDRAHEREINRETRGVQRTIAEEERRHGRRLTEMEIEDIYRQAGEKRGEQRAIAGEGRATERELDREVRATQMEVEREKRRLGRDLTVMEMEDVYKRLGENRQEKRTIAAEDRAIEENDRRAMRDDKFRQAAEVRARADEIMKELRLRGFKDEDTQKQRMQIAEATRKGIEAINRGDMAEAQVELSKIGMKPDDVGALTSKPGGGVYKPDYKTDIAPTGEVYTTEARTGAVTTKRDWPGYDKKTLEKARDEVRKGNASLREITNAIRLVEDTPSAVGTVGALQQAASGAIGQIPGINYITGLSNLRDPDKVQQVRTALNTLHGAIRPIIEGGGDGGGWTNKAEMDRTKEIIRGLQPGASAQQTVTSLVIAAQFQRRMVMRAISEAIPRDPSKTLLNRENAEARRAELLAAYGGTISKDIINDTVAQEIKIEAGVD